MDIDKALEADQGFLVSGGPFYTGGTASPVGLDLPTGTLYLQTTSSGVLIFRKFNTGVNDWRQLSAQDIPLVDTSGYFRSGINDVEECLKSIREQRLSKLDIRDTDTESFHVLDNTDFTFHEAIGSGTGYYFRLPDATTLVTGQEFEVSNQSTNSIEIRDGSNALLLTLNSNDIVRVIITDISTVAGVWIVQVSSGTATGIQSYSIGSVTLFSTTSATDTLVTGLTVTPASGRYGLWFSADVQISTNNADAQVVIFQSGSALERTRRNTQGAGSNFLSTISTIAEVTVDGTEELQVRVNISSGSLDLRGRRLLLIRLGS